MNLTIAMAQLNLVDWISAAPFAGSKSADKSECSKWMKEGQEGDAK
jgi:hypothetical protein